MKDKENLIARIKSHLYEVKDVNDLDNIEKLAYWFHSLQNSSTNNKKSDEKEKTNVDVNNL
ncbi:TPA: hypothetical protein KRE72_003408 [Clostridioides difficile]|uniref:Uncharacterized protein n=1 Tax=Clostridioides difficile TaxID=1496 RepID=A0AB74QI88_CLODI|nr:MULTISPECIES: hypothetical protein [Clostridioides]MCC0699480.1 hypothetical protein [Clostridioides sp. ZZV15-6383]MCC0784475.1 hypothetical protein [Clostridioides sp. ES-S-0108-01]MCD8633475.1 hypothetical protein [Clostridioides difficile]MCF2715114.1 hypothetical protein [Clostridioides difficile]MCI4874958.1 hypothetical protein [Clostridioides difficile]